MARKKSSRKRARVPSRKSRAKKSSDPRSYRNIPEKAAGSYPKKVGNFKVVKTKVDGKVAYKITGFSKKPAKIVFREDKAAEFMRRRAKEAKAFRNNPHCQNNPLEDDGFEYEAAFEYDEFEDDEFGDDHYIDGDFDDDYE